jgi:dipeptidyl aminopeptidase/acylaminoacyl peptidase
MPSERHAPRAALRRALLLVTVLAPTLAAAERRPIFEQIDLPHPYYYHELYLPELTGGPSGVAFLPDSQSLVYSMAGSLWRQRLDSTVAEQLTDGPGYDYQPDVSPDGRHVVYTSYRGGALELCELDLGTLAVRELTHDGAVNVEPRYAPDGARIAFVSTAYQKHFHIFVAPLDARGLGTPVRLTGETRSPLKRYYYSAFDHEISPTWTPDGRSLLYVSNRGHIHGTGGFWQVAAVPGAEARELHYEETNWRARPELSPDGTRLLYSSYLGRNWHQLWLMPAAGGDALPVTYGEWDAVGARFSRDGRLIAYLSNAGGGLELVLHDVVGGAERTLAVTERRTLKPTARLAIHLTENGAPGAARVSVVGPDGRFYAPAGAWIHGDDGYDRAERPFEAHYFHATGDVEVEVPEGKGRVEVLHGFRGASFAMDFEARAGRTIPFGAAWTRTDTKAAGGGHWVSADAHVHMNYGGLYRNYPAHLVEQAAAEDLDLVHALIVNKEQRVPDIAYSGRGLDPASTALHQVLFGQEYHTSYWGHLGILGPAGNTLLPGYVGYPNTAAASLAPTNADVADLAHARGALVGYVHPFDEEPHPFDARETLTDELPIDVALGKVDYLEVMGFADYRTTARVWYRLLNLGFRLPAAAGTDAMANYASLRGPVGMDRVYVRVPDAPLEARAWLDGLKAGRSFASNGPLLEFTLGGQPVGGELEFRRAPGAVPFTAHLASIVPVDHLDVICNGKVARRIALDASGPNGGARTGADARGTLPLGASGWCLLRAESAHAEYPVLDGYVYATTSPVYVTVAGEPPRAPAEAKYFLAWVARVRAATAAYPDWNSAAEKAAVLAEIDAAHAVFERLQ